MAFFCQAAKLTKVWWCPVKFESQQQHRASMLGEWKSHTHLSLSLSLSFCACLAVVVHTPCRLSFFFTLLVYFTFFLPFLTCPCLTTSVYHLLHLHHTTHDESGRKYGTCASQTKSSPITSILFSPSWHLMLSFST